MVKGVVINVGSGLTHAAIVGREYGIPVVVGTIEATAKSSTGQKIRVKGRVKHD